MQLRSILPKNSGRNAHGRVTIRHQGGRQKRFLRVVDFKRDKRDLLGRVLSIEYDPNRGADIALIVYADGDRRYIIAPNGLVVGRKVIASEYAPLEPGNALPLGKIPVGYQIHNIEIRPGKGGQIARGAGIAASIQGKENDYVLVKMPSGEIRRFVPEVYATLGQVGNIEARNEVIGKAGRARKMGRRPGVRGTAQHPGSHPHGGGEGRSGVGLKYPKTPWGKKAVGKTRAKKKYSDRLIISRRGKGRRA